MPVTDQTTTNTYTGNGVTTVFAYSFKALAEADITVTVDGTTKTLTTDYTLSGIGTANGGNVTFVTAPASDAEVVITRDMDFTRDIDYQDNGDLLAATLDEDVDRTVMLIQQIRQIVRRAIRAPVAETSVDELPSADDRASKYLAFDADGQPVATSGTTSDIIVSAFIETLLDDANAAAARATLGAFASAGGNLSGMLVEAEGAAVASASSCNIWATDGNTCHITGTTQIDDFATAPQAGAWKKVIFDDALILNQSANLNLNGGGSDITTAAGDMALVYADTTTQMDVFLIRKSGREVAPATPLISVSYDSGDRTITAAGALTLAHSLGAAPKFIQCLLKCNDAGGDIGYTNGQYVFINTTGSDAGSGSLSTGVSIIPDATNLNVRFGSDAGVFYINNATTGALNSITPSKWKFIVRAYA